MHIMQNLTVQEASTKIVILSEAKDDSEILASYK